MGLITKNMKILKKDAKTGEVLEEICFVDGEEVSYELHENDGLDIVQLLEDVIFTKAVFEFNSTPEVGEKFDVEKHNYANDLLNKHGKYIYDECMKKMFPDAEPFNK